MITISLNSDQRASACSDVEGLENRAFSKPEFETDDLKPVSDLFFAGYANLVGKGYPESSVAMALVGAAIKFSCVFGATGQAADTLRRAADLIEGGGI